jgi:hypothetical protein
MSYNHYVDAKKNIRLKQCGTEDMHETLNAITKVTRVNPY